jgi:quercetin dioxygenase-like cupin family protein
MSFVNVDDLPRMALFPQALSGLVAGEQIMLSFLNMEEGCEVPEHSHPHEQAGLVLAGAFRFRIGSEEKVTGPGDAFIVPPNVVHAGVVEEGPARILDIFSPPREDYMARYNKYAKTSSKTVWEA